MLRFDVQKEVRREALIIGLKMRAFCFFFAVFLFVVFSLINGFSFFRFVCSIALIAIAYGAALLFQNLDLGQYFSSLPKTLINR